MSLYEDLKIKADASAADIRAAWRRMAKTLHPDVNPDDPDAASKFQRALVAYETLSDTDRRAHYDNTGETGENQSSIAERAKAAARQALLQALSDCNDGEIWAQNIVNAARGILSGNISNFTSIKKQAASNAANLKRLRERTAGQELLFVIDGEIRTAQSNESAMAMNIEVATMARQMLADGYRHDVDPKPAQDSVDDGVWITFDGAGGFSKGVRI